ncbi:MAG: LEA type 2 family protein [Thermoplasmata archaeon]|nr:MAG: LEA type 2 family protein [Thermoplasmata archaeon]
MEKKIFFGIIIVIVIIMVILAGLVLSIKEPAVQVSEIEFKSISILETSISFDVTLRVDNDNLFGATLKKVEADIIIDGTDIGDTYSEEEFEIEAKEISEVTVVLTVTSVPTTILGKSQIQVQVSGTAHVKVSFFDFELPIDKTETVNIF